MKSYTKQLINKNKQKKENLYNTKLKLFNSMKQQLYSANKICTVQIEIIKYCNIWISHLSPDNRF